jgi:hypothetical protein
MFLAFGINGFSQSDSIVKPTLKLGHRFYLKTEVLNSLARMAFAPNTFDYDVQGTVMITNKFHWVNTYGKATFNLSDSVESIERAGVYMIQKRTGKAEHRSSSMLRCYPFENWKSAVDYLFIEGGVHFQHYTGATAGMVRDSMYVIESQFEQQLEFFRFGPQINVGISMRFADWDIYDDKKRKRRISFSPEALIGVVYNHLYLIKDDFTQLVGLTDVSNAPYSEKKLRLTLRAKIGIGLF